MTGISTKRKSIIDSKKNELGDYIRLAWCFNKPYEKIILILIGVLGIWKIFDIIVAFMG